MAASQPDDITGMFAEMTPAEGQGLERESDDLLAAEYVLGVLSAEERQSIAPRIERDAAFARLIDEWEVRLSPLATGYPQAEAPASVKTAIDRRLFTSNGASPATAPPSSWWESLVFWRALAAAAIAAVIITVAIPYINPPRDLSRPNLIASLAADGSDVKYLAVYDAARRDVGLSHVSGARAPGKDFELWMIENNKPPVSMGVIPIGALAHVAVSPDVRNKLAQGAVLAITLEPAGGSSTGRPTGPVVASGDLKGI